MISPSITNLLKSIGNGDWEVSGDTVVSKPMKLEDAQKIYATATQVLGFAPEFITDGTIAQISIPRNKLPAQSEQPELLNVTQAVAGVKPLSKYDEKFTEFLQIVKKSNIPKNA